MMPGDMGAKIAMTRARLFTIRFAATAVCLLLIYGLLRQLWYPGGYFELFGTGKLFWMLALAVLIVGPGLSTLVFRPGKKGLLFDLATIALIEIAIFSWAVAEMYQRQPAFAVFAVDRFEAVRRDEVSLEQFEFGHLARRPGHAPRLIYAELPTDVDVMSRLIDETVFLGMADIDRRPEFWKPYPQGIRTLRAVARPLADLILPGDARAERIRRWLDEQSSPRPVSDYAYLPIKGGRADGTMILHADIAYPVAVVAVDPW